MAGPLLIPQVPFRFAIHLLLPSKVRPNTIPPRLFAVLTVAPESRDIDLPSDLGVLLAVRGPACCPPSSHLRPEVPDMMRHQFRHGYPAALSRQVVADGSDFGVDAGRTPDRRMRFLVGLIVHPSPSFGLSPVRHPD